MQLKLILKTLIIEFVKVIKIFSIDWKLMLSKVINQYDCRNDLIFFDLICVVQADPGAIGGNHSHEYHLISDIGEDTIHLCSNCNQGFSEEYIEKQQSNQSKYCDSCNCDLQAKQSIEVGHAFYLATRYTQPFRCFYRSKTNNYR